MYFYSVPPPEDDDIIEATRSTNIITDTRSANIITGTSSSSNSSSSSGINIITTFTGTNIITTFTDNITSSMVDITSNSVTYNSSDHPMITDTATIEHGNSKSANIPVILASVFGSLLGLCVIACIVGLMYKRQKKKYPFKAGIFTLAAYNTAFRRYVDMYV